MTQFSLLELVPQSLHINYLCTIACMVRKTTPLSVVNQSPFMNVFVFAYILISTLDILGGGNLNLSSSRNHGCEKSDEEKLQRAITCSLLHLFSPK